MLHAMNQPVRHLLRLAALLLVAVQGSAEPAAETGSSEIRVRVYEGFDGKGSGDGADDQPYAIDVGTTIKTCPDGNTTAQALDIGGKPYPLDSPCSARTPETRIRVDAGSAQSGTATNGESSADMRCDPSRWRCKPQAR